MPKRKARKVLNPNPEKKIKQEEKTTELQNVISDYEKNILENIRKNQELLLELNILQARDDLRASQQQKKKPAKTVKSVRMKTEELPRRHSLRIRNLEPDGITPAPELPEISFPSIQRKTRPEGPIPMALANEAEEEDAKALLSSFDNLLTKSKSKKSSAKVHLNSDCSSYKLLMDKMKVLEDNVIKVVPSRVFSVMFHGSDTKTILFVGDKKGHLGLWDVDSKQDDNVFVYEPHVSPITAMVLEPTNNNKLLTCSYDGSIRCADFEKSVFDEVCGLDDDTGFTYMSLGTTSAQTLLASTDNGEVHIIDARTDNENHPCYDIQDRSIKCLDVHPQNSNIFVTSTNKGIISLWDVRSVKGPKSCLNTFSRSRSVSSVFFSPLNGEQLLTTSMDNFVSVYDVDATGKTKPYISYRHDNYTGRWLSPLHARWDPKTCNCFAVGSMKFPRQIDIFSSEYKSGPLTHLQHENFTTITSRIAFHPTRNILAGANSSGKVFLWTT